MAAILNPSNLRMLQGLFLVAWAFAAQAQADERPIAAGGSRPLWTTSRVVGSPEPPLPYRARRAFPKLSFEKPRGVRCEPGSGRILVIERGRVIALPNEDEAAETRLFLDSPDYDVYSIAFHPRYSENRYIYAFTNDGYHPVEPKFNRIFRYRAAGSPLACDPASRTLVLEWQSIGHDGGDLAFGSDNMLYIGSGDGTVDFDANESGQDLSDLCGGILRIDVDRAGTGKAYAIPADNPFLDRQGVRHELWAYGLRNPWRISFDSGGRLWVGEIGQDRWDMIHLARAGRNYGWSVYEGTHVFQPSRKLGPDPVTPPIIEHSHAEARSIIGGFVYEGKRFPELVGAYLYGDWETGKIWGLRFDGERVTWNSELADTTCRILGFGLDANGEIYFADHGGGQICTIERMPAQQQKQEEFPGKLSETGIFADVKLHRPSPGLVAYDVNSPLWSDGAKKERLLGLPGASRIEFSADQPWQFPEGAVLVKTFSLPLVGTSEPQRIETRIFTRQQGDWIGYSYAWNDHQSDAKLVEKHGADRTFDVIDDTSEGGIRKQRWHYPSRAECMMCHTSAAGFVLGFSLEQLNRRCSHDPDYNQLEWCFEQAVFRVAGKDVNRIPDDPVTYPALVDPQSRTASTDSRARSYLHANCAHCHMPNGGGNAFIDLRAKGDGATLRLWDRKPEHSSFALSNALLLAPGHPERSVLLHRISTSGLGRMPPLSSAVVDQSAVSLLTEWVRNTKVAPIFRSPPEPRAKP